MQADKVDAFMEYVNGEIEKMDWANAKPMKPTWERKPAPMWDLASGVAFCRQLESALEGKWHVSLGGSVLYRGYSDKDLDISLRAHSMVGHYHHIAALMKDYGWTAQSPDSVYGEHQRGPGGNLSIQVWAKRHLRVDLFITMPDKEPESAIDVPGVIPF